MRKGLLCVPMIALLLLSACAGGGEGRQAAELALTIRGEWLEESDCAASMDVTADYGQRVYQYEMDLLAEDGEVRLTLTAPDTVAGITARAVGNDSFLEYDGLVLETGPLDEAGLTPVAAVPALLEAIQTGYITACGLEENAGRLRVDCGDPEGTPGIGREITLWFNSDTHALEQGEIRSDGFRVISCAFHDFTQG